MNGNEVLERVRGLYETHFNTQHPSDTPLQARVQDVLANVLGTMRGQPPNDTEVTKTIEALVQIGGANWRVDWSSFNTNPKKEIKRITDLLRGSN